MEPEVQNISSGKNVFSFKGSNGVVFIRDSHGLQKKKENDDPLDIIRFQSIVLKPSFMEEDSQHICYAQIPIQSRFLGVRSVLNHQRNAFDIWLDFIYTGTESIAPEEEIKTFYLFDNFHTYSEADIPNNDQYLRELNDDEYELSYMKYIGTVTIPQLTRILEHPPFYERNVHIFAREYGKINNWTL